MAAGWVRWFNVEKGYKVRYWEIGNEGYGGWEEGHKLPNQPDLTGEIYGKDFVVMAKAMRQVDPDILIGAVAVDEDNGDAWSGYGWWVRGMPGPAGGAGAFLLQHEYLRWPVGGRQRGRQPQRE